MNYEVLILDIFDCFEGTNIGLPILADKIGEMANKHSADYFKQINLRYEREKLFFLILIVAK